MSKNNLIVLTIVLFGIIAVIFISGSGKNNGTNSVVTTNSEIKNGIQYIMIDAKNGYSPQVSSAKAGIPTKLIVKTYGSYGCFSSLNIKSIGYQNVLPQTGETEIDIGTPKAGVPLQGVCGMGMYNFLINFN